MKATQKITFLSILILLSAAVFAYGQESNQPPQPAQPQEASPLPPESPQEPRVMFDEGYINKLLEDLKKTDPNQAQKLEKLRQENPRLFQVEIRRLAWQQHRASQEGMESARPRRGAVVPPDTGMENEPGALRGRERLREMQTEFLNWLSKNEPNKASELAALKDKDPVSYNRRLAVEMKKYRPVIEAERTNPALAELLKKELVLKEKRNALLEELKGTTDEKQKQELTAQLKKVIFEMIDVEEQKKQLQYEELKKKLEELQKEVKKSQADLENYKKNKEELLKKDMDELINKPGQSESK